jgi:hypothetical protein
LKRLILTSLILVTLATMLLAQSLNARIEGDQLRVVNSRVHFLTGEALTRLRDGATVRYTFQLTAKADKSGRVLARTDQQFAVSYDLWEEKFAVKTMGPSTRSISHLSAAAAEAWCVEKLSMPVGELNSSPSFWLRLDYRAEDSTAPAAATDNSGFTLSGLVDIFSRRTRSEQLRGFDEIGPLQIDSLKKK